MNYLAHLCAAVVLMCALAAPAAADPVKITFDTPPCAPLSSAPQNCYAGSGALFSSQGPGDPGMAAFTIASDSTAVSAPNVARPLAGFPTLHAEFFQVSPPLGFGTNAVSFHVTGSVAGQSPWEVVFFSTDSALATFHGVSDELVSFTFGDVPRGGDIGILGFNLTGGTASQGIDDLTFNGTGLAAAPEPATWLLVTTAALALVRRRRRDGAQADRR
jgi:hypothetical protein